MKLTDIRPSPVRATLASMMAAAGGIVSIAMVTFGGSTARHLPSGEGFHTAAIIGAGLAGLACAACFGRPGWQGWMIAAIGAIVATLAGAFIGSSLFGFGFGAFTGGGLGLIAILGAAENPIAVAIWGLTMAAVHLAARRVRAAGDVSP